MYDSSHSPIDENVANTKKLVEICAEHGMSLEAEGWFYRRREGGVVGTWASARTHQGVQENCRPGNRFPGSWYQRKYPWKISGKLERG